MYSSQDKMALNGKKNIRLFFVSDFQVICPSFCAHFTVFKRIIGALRIDASSWESPINKFKSADGAHLTQNSKSKNKTAYAVDKRINPKSIESSGHEQGEH